MKSWQYLTVKDFERVAECLKYFRSQLIGNKLVRSGETREKLSNRSFHKFFFSFIRSTRIRRLCLKMFIFAFMLLRGEYSYVFKFKDHITYHTTSSTLDTGICTLKINRLVMFLTFGFQRDWEQSAWTK